MREKMLTIREAAHYLGITEKQIIDLSDKGVIPAYRVGGVYLRFKKEQLDAIKDRIEPTQKENNMEYTFSDQMSDFFYYNDFYILSLLIISILIFQIISI
ncbi:helix-turn-helix domain-containing protein [Candidatus Omnitrophota bacterium]